MKMNRRNALLGIGAIATGGGALFGSGAFSQVSADRTVRIGVEGDGAAQLQLAANASTGIANNSSGSSSNEVGINATKLNVDADTTFKTVLDITNNAQDGNAKLLGIESPSVSGGTVDFIAYQGVNDDLTGDRTLSSDAVTLNNGATLTVGIKAQINETGANISTQQVSIQAVESSSDFTSPISGLTSADTETN
jgi:hypothetical protein